MIKFLKDLLIKKQVAKVMADVFGKIKDGKIEVKKLDDGIKKLQEIVNRANVNGDEYIDYKDVIAEVKNRLKGLL